MNKLPTRQIYLLSIIVIGIISLSVYSTYAIFTLESETSDIVSIHTPNSLQISTDMYEYQQVTISKNSYITTDIDLYNNFEYDLCYSIWYKIVSTSSVDGEKVKIYQSTPNSLTTSGTLPPITSSRITLLIINDNDSDAKVNIGVSSSKFEETCALNISKDKSLITTTINNPEKLSTKLIENTSIETKESNYLTYKDITSEIVLSNENKIYISNNFTYQDELFTLTEPVEIISSEIEKNVSNDAKSYYTCLENDSCRFLYKINETSSEIVEDKTDTPEDERLNSIYKITKYDKLIGYLGGENGLRKITKNNITNYAYYGDNPNNYIYYNCTNEQNTKTCELWRIIGIFYNQENNEYLTKIIKDESIGTFKYSETNNTWNKSLINKYLNEEYKLQNSGYINEITFKEENITSLEIAPNEISTLNDINKSKITIMSLSDYLNASVCTNKLINEYDKTCLNNNWLNKNTTLNDWTYTLKYIEPTINEETKETITYPNNTLYSVGTKISENIFTQELNIRPVVYLKSRIFLTDGLGTFEEPYIIK